ncbi:DNA repair protein XRCC3-like isoform X2 [Mya arenaria]|uniref:DNA repair protein XRCC3-like isoform X2 n=1 Tax=Mya arenaria TaxID=6604 RepID=UPI0022E2DE39|nr:DNA repair protein XRCC3-like isoform X2 [Mya arenaria]
MSEIDDLDVQQRLKNALRRSRLTTLKSILYLTEPVGNLGAEDIQTIKIAAAKKLSVLKPVTGGLLCRGITEISGESSSGKTQFALQLSLTAQLAPLYGGLDAGTLYICTEDAFPSKRLYQMIENFTSRHGKKLCTHGNLGDKIFIEHVPDFDSLMHCLTHKAPVLLKSGAIKLIVVDSIAAHFRSDYEGHEMYKRAQHIGALGTLLYTHSHEYNIPVVCINQVTSSMKPEGRQLIPSLGLSWSSQVTTRIMLTRTDRSLTIQQESARGPLETVVREMEIVYAPHLPPLTVPYVIDHEGMKGFA